MKRVINLAVIEFGAGEEIVLLTHEFIVDDLVFRGLTVPVLAIEAFFIAETPSDLLPNPRPRSAPNPGRALSF